MCLSLISLRLQQCFYGTALVHSAVAFRHLIERQSQIENLAGVDLPIQHQLYQVWQVTAHWRGTAMQMHVGKEQLCPVEFNPMRYANVAHEPARSCGTDGLHHRFLGANA